MSDKVFTDEELKLLKEADSNELIPVYKLDALLSRLEAAEVLRDLKPIAIQWILDCLDYTGRNTIVSNEHYKVIKALKAWRKSRGS